MLLHTSVSYFHDKLLVDDHGSLADQHIAVKLALLLVFDTRWCDRTTRAARGRNPRYDLLAHMKNACTMERVNGDGHGNNLD